MYRGQEPSQLTNDTLSLTEFVSGYVFMRHLYLNSFRGSNLNCLYIIWTWAHWAEHSHPLDYTWFSRRPTYSRLRIKGPYARR